MTVSNKKEAIFLFVGDVFFFLLSLWLTLFVRYLEVPTWEIFYDHIIPFSILFIFWFVVFFIAGLYEKHTLILKSKIPTIIFNSQLINSTIAVVFFYYLFPVFEITPRTNLVIYIAISFLLMLGWRIYGSTAISVRNKQKAILIGSGDEMQELKDEVNNNSRYDLYFISSIDLNDIDSLDFQEEILKRIYSEGVQVIAIDLKNEKVEPILPNLYNLIFSKVRFIDMYKIYEEIFDRIPLSLVRYNWFLENISVSTNKIHDTLKRALDLFISTIAASFSLIFYPFVIVAIKLEDGGPIFFTQDRIGQNNKVIKTLKFRSMTPHSERDGIAKNPQVTRTGAFLRKTRFDEIPQLWNVIKGDLSLIGPRPEIPALVKVYEKEIPYYNIRHLIKPGLSGWAQLYQRTPPKWSAGLSQTKIKLSYDLYYLKNRSFMLDIKIVLKTLKTLFSHSGV
jgi:exopolysaccharide biosynthesis polyprenyl glycosylphosphotransferase